MTEEEINKYKETNDKPLDLTLKEPSFKKSDNSVDLFDERARKEFEYNFDRVLKKETTVDEVTETLDSNLKETVEYKQMKKEILNDSKDNIVRNVDVLTSLQDAFPLVAPQFVIDARLRNSLKVTAHTVESAFSKHHRQFKTFADDALDGVVTGQKSINEATDEFVKRMNREGLSKVTLSDGRQMRADAYIKTYIRSEHNRIDTDNVNEVMDEYDLDVFLISTHTHRAPRDGCAPYEHAIVSRSGNTTQIEDVDGNIHTVIPLSETSYGRPDGIFGINCTHSKSPVVPGLFEYGSKPSLKVKSKK